MLKMTFVAVATRDVLLPGFLGNTVRGTLGRCLVDLYCKMPPETRPENISALCGKCAFAGSCVYTRVFKDPGGKDRISVPNPYVIEVPFDNRRAYVKGDELTFSVTLFGYATAFAGEILAASTSMFHSRFAKQSDCFRVVRVYNGYSTGQLIMQDKRGAEVLPDPYTWSDEGAESIGFFNRIELTFLTRTKIYKNKALVDNPDFAIFIDSLFSRIADIIDLYGDGRFVVPYSLCYKKPHVETRTDLKRLPLSLEKQQEDGILGTLLFTAHSGSLSEYLPYIDLGTQLHLGSRTTLGFGQYEMAFKNCSTHDLFR